MMNVPSRLLYLILIATGLRIIAASVLELSNDEVYYYLYAIDLQPNYFDHPPAVALLIRIFTLNLSFTHELFVRLGAIACSAVGTVIVFQLGSLMKNERTGWFAAILYNTSIYTSLIAGTFIIPDSPQVVFWLAALWIMYRIIVQADQKLTIPLSDWLLFGLFTGLCILCKVHGIFLWFAFGLYVLFYQLRLLRSLGLYWSVLLTIVVISPILWWNIQNDFITYRFHSGRVGLQESVFRADYFLQAVGGQLLYNNPINVVLLIIALWKLRSMNFLDRTAIRFILLSGLPIILVVTTMSLFNSMLPHWSGPGFMTMGFLAAAYLDEITTKKSLRLPLVLRGTSSLITVALFLAILLINFYPGTLGSHDQERYGDGDFTLDMYGWKEFEGDFKPWLEDQKQNHILPADIKIVSNKWFPAAHIDYYVAMPLKLTVIGVGDVTDLHQYYWLNKMRPALQKGESALCILPSNYQVMEQEGYSVNFASAELLQTFENKRGGEVIRYFKVYLLKDYQMNDEVHLK